MADRGAPSWRCTHDLNRVLQSWEGEQHAVFFDPATGDTHLIHVIGALLAELGSAGPQTEPALLAALAEAVDPVEAPDAAGLQELLRTHLHRLVVIGLLEEVVAP